MIGRVAAAVVLALSLGAALPASAFAGERGGWWAQAQQRPQPQRERQYQPPQRRFEGEREAPPQRLTPDERRQLRRDLHDANRDIHPQRRDWRR